VRLNNIGVSAVSCCSHYIRKFIQKFMFTLARLKFLEQAKHCSSCRLHFNGSLRGRNFKLTPCELLRWFRYELNLIEDRFKTHNYAPRRLFSLLERQDVQGLADPWMTSHIWRRFLQMDVNFNLDDESFEREFHNLVGGSVPPTDASSFLTGPVMPVPLAHVMPLLPSQISTFNRECEVITAHRNSELKEPIRQALSRPQSFFLTKSGFWGIGPPGTKEGDKLALLFGKWFFPMIIRENEESHQMAGPALLDESLLEMAKAECDCFDEDDSKFEDILFS
jgi:hypothetical protein